MESLFGNSNVQYCLPQRYLKVYQHIDDNFCEYGESNEISVGCCCESTCSGHPCICLTGDSCNYKEDGTLAFIDDLLSDPLYTKAVFECNSCCLCSELCQNRIVQRGLAFKLRVVEVEGKGFGVKAVETIPKGSYVIDYAGEVLCTEEAEIRMKMKRGDENNYLLTVRENFGAKSVRTFIDAAKFGNVSRFINHSCLPNLLLHPVRVDFTVPRLALFAKRDISVGEELSFDYGGGNPDECVSNRRVICHCNAPNCQGYLPAEPLNDLSTV